MGRDDGSVLCPTVMINSGRYSMCRRSGGKNIHNHTFVVTVYGEIHFPAIRRTPMPVEDILPAFPVPVPVDIPPNPVDTLSECFLFLISVDVILVYGKQTLYEESCLYQVASIVFLAKRFHLSGVTIPPVGVGSVETVCFFEERNDAFHPCPSLFAGDVAAVDSRKDSHDAETAAAGSDYIGIVFRIYAVHMIPFGSQTAIRFGTFPEIEESPSLNGVHQGVVRQGVGGGSKVVILAFPFTALESQSDGG